MKFSYTRILYIVVCFCFCPFIQAQNEANYWYFGDHAGIDFSSGSPVGVFGSAMYTQEGCATISNSEGQLLFYTDGSTIYNHNHEIMMNGSGLNGHFSSTQSAIIVPDPGSNTLYYVFTVDFEGSSDGLQYSIVDMTLDGGLGAVTATKNELLLTPVMEKLTAIKHANGQDIWVMAHANGSADYYAYLVTSDGISAPVVTTIGSSYGGFTYANNAGYLKFSPDGSKLAAIYTKWTHGLQLFDFDNQTGVLSNYRDVFYEMAAVGIPYGVEFSPSGDLVYVSGTEGLYQYDLSYTSNFDVLFNAHEIADDYPEGLYSALQLGPDEKIYVCKAYTEGDSENHFLSVIENPDLIGDACNFQEEAVDLGAGIVHRGLPQFIQSFFNVTFNYTNACYGEVTQFEANVGEEYDALVWDFGDGITATGPNPEHQFEAAGIYDVSLTVTVAGESITDTKQLEIFDIPSIVTNTTIVQCDDDLDGISLFNLDNYEAMLSEDYENLSFSFYHTENDAVQDENSIEASNSYTNETAFNETIWFRATNEAGCSRISSVVLEVSATQIPDTYFKELYYCDDDLISDDGFYETDFSIVEEELAAMFSDQELQFSFYESLEDAYLAVDAIENSATYTNTIPFEQDLFVRVASVDGACIGVGYYITLHVYAQPSLEAIEVPVLCDEDGDGLGSFDTATVEEELLNGQSNVVISYVDANGNQLPSPLPNPFESPSQIITARAINTLAPEAVACFVEIPLVFEVNPFTVANEVEPLVSCDADGDGIASFDTTAISDTVIGTQENVTINYFDEAGNELGPELPNPFISASTTITARVTNNVNSNCVAETALSFIVAVQPFAIELPADVFCIAEGEGYPTISLQNYNNQILGGQSYLSMEVSYYLSEEDAEVGVNPLNDIYTITSNALTLFARVENLANPGCYATTSFDILVTGQPQVFEPVDLQFCDAFNDGVEEVDLTAAISSLDSQEGIVVSYYASYEEASLGENAINDPQNYEMNTSLETLYVRVENIASASCFYIRSFDVALLEVPILNMKEEWILCEGSSVQLVADSGFDNYYWSTGETSASIVVSEAGTYEVTVSENHGAVTCQTTTEVVVTTSTVPIIVAVETKDWTESSNQVIVFSEGEGSYEYSIDGQYYQDSNVFYDLSFGDYTVYVRDKNGCGIATDELFLMYYPKFFTPNSDGVNDYWQIFGLENEPKSIVYIYDRYGKLLAQLQANSNGWNGTYKGSKMPSDDYWFVLQRFNGRQHRGHFSLKR